jgi:GNAT superfamily N-acetyltransferase
VFSIRNAGIDDVPLIRQLTFQVWPQTYTSIISKEQIDYMLKLFYDEAVLKKQIGEEGHQFIIVYDDDAPVGFAGFSEIEPAIFKLHKLYVLGSQQGKGTGKLLIEHIRGIIKAKGATALRLQVNRYNKAKAFYEKLGFVIIAEGDFDIGNGFYMNDYVMERRVEE